MLRTSQPDFAADSRSPKVNVLLNMEALKKHELAGPRDSGNLF